MDKCPKCGRWMLGFDPVKGVVHCYNCDYEEKVNIEEYLEKNDLMPKLLKSLELNGYET